LKLIIRREAAFFIETDCGVGKDFVSAMLACTIPEW
jgi:hypothetical protein